MIISRDMVSESIDISKLIVKENLAQPTMPNKADTEKYNSVIKPKIDAFEAKYSDNPRMILKKLLDTYIVDHNISEEFEAQGVHYWGRRISSHVWATITRKDKAGKYTQNKISNYPQLYVLINAACVKFGLCYGNYVPESGEMVKIVKENVLLQDKMFGIIQQDFDSHFFKKIIANELPTISDQISISAVSDIANNWSRDVHVIKYFQQNNIPENIESEITTTFDKLLTIFLEISQADINRKVVEQPKGGPLATYWFVGAHWGEDGDQATRFIENGIWENGYKDRYLDDVKAIKPGERIAIKSAYTRKKGLPFDNKGNVVAVMAIKAVGTVVNNLGDGRKLEVDWVEQIPPREWYFFTNLYTVWKVEPDNWYKEELIDFTFNNKPQNYAKFQNDPFWQKRFGYAPIGEPGGEVDAQPYSIDNILSDGCFLERAELETMLKRLRAKKNLILQGPPGTGKTWLATRLAFALIGRRDDSKVKSMQFHPNLSYEDFIRGWRPGSDGKLSLIDGPFMEMISTASIDPSSTFVVVIEEINRGNPAQIFGEMLTLLEVDRRTPAEALELCYRKSDGERVYIPNNLYVVGTMNIADRSLAIVDFALRRRFAFIDLKPQINKAWRDWVSIKCGLDQKSLVEIEKRILALNNEIASDINLGKQFCIGHSFVTPPNGTVIKNTVEWFKEVVDTEIGQLLEEYWFDSLEKARSAKQRLIEGL